MGVYVALFTAGVLTILLPCILPLIPVVLGVSIADRNPLRPAFTVLGMLVSFVGFTFLLFLVLHQFAGIAELLRIGTYYVLLLFGVGFLTQRTAPRIAGSVAGALFFLHEGIVAVSLAAIFGSAAVLLGGKIAQALQSAGHDAQNAARDTWGTEHPLAAFLIGLTLGLVWVPCAGPALGFAFTLVRDEPGLRAFFLLVLYGLGTAIPLFFVGYGGQKAVHSVRFLSRYSGQVKRVSGILLLFTAIAFRLHWFTALETWFVTRTPFGFIGTDLELRLFGDDVGRDIMQTDRSLLSP